MMLILLFVTLTTSYVTVHTQIITKCPAEDPARFSYLDDTHFSFFQASLITRNLPSATSFFDFNSLKPFTVHFAAPEHIPLPSVQEIEIPKTHIVHLTEFITVHKKMTDTITKTESKTASSIPTDVKWSIHEIIRWVTRSESFIKISKLTETRTISAIPLPPKTVFITETMESLKTEHVPYPTPVLVSRTIEKTKTLIENKFHTESKTISMIMTVTATRESLKTERMPYPTPVLLTHTIEKTKTLIENKFHTESKTISMIMTVTATRESLKTERVPYPTPVLVTRTIEKTKTFIERKPAEEKSFLSVVTTAVEVKFPEISFDPLEYFKGASQLASSTLINLNISQFSTRTEAPSFIITTVPFSSQFNPPKVVLPYDVSTIFVTPVRSSVVSVPPTLQVRSYQYITQTYIPIETVQRPLKYITSTFSTVKIRTKTMYQ